MCAANGLHEDADGFDTCNGTCDDDEARCGSCGELLHNCGCEPETVETAALDVPAVSEAETVRRQFRDELAALLRRADAAEALGATSGVHARAAGTFDGGIVGLLIRRCGMSLDDVKAARGRR